MPTYPTLREAAQSLTVAQRQRALALASEHGIDPDKTLYVSRTSDGTEHTFRLIVGQMVDLTIDMAGSDVRVVVESVDT
jgi:hypothetical protein